MTGADTPTQIYDFMTMKALTDMADSDKADVVNIADMERAYYHNNKTYYKIWPEVFDEFMNTRMDVPSEFMIPAHTAFSINLPILDDPLLSYHTTSGEWIVESIIVSRLPKRDMYVEEDVKGKVGKDAKVNGKEMPNRPLICHRIAVPEEASERGMPHITSYMTDIPTLNDVTDIDVIKEVEILSIKINMANRTATNDELLEKQFNMKSSGMRPEGAMADRHFVRHLAIIPGMTIEESVGLIEDSKLEHSNVEDDTPASIIEAGIRIIMGVCFLSTGSHKVLSHDITKKLMDKYLLLRHQNKKKEMMEVVKKSRKRNGPKGYHIGYQLDGRLLMLPRGVNFNDASVKAGSHKHLYRHTRGGHWRLQRHGKGNKEVKLIRMEDVVVKPDLPVKPLVS